MQWYQKAADQGNAAAQNNLASIYQIGKGGINQDCSTAVQWYYRKAADQGNATAQYNLGYIFETGAEVDIAEIFSLFKQLLRLLRTILLLPPKAEVHGDSNNIFYYERAMPRSSPHFYL